MIIFIRWDKIYNMAINQNHLFEDIDGIKCAVVEKNVTQDRIAFIKPLLELNGFTVIAAATPAPKTIPATENPEPQDAPATFTVGVTDVGFNVINAIFGRLLRTKEDRVVTLAYWHQKDIISDDSIPYFENDK